MDLIFCSFVYCHCKCSTYFFSTRSAQQNTPFTIRLSSARPLQLDAQVVTGFTCPLKIVLLMKIQVISGRKHAWLQRKGPVPALLPVTILLILHSEWNSSPGLPALSPMCVFCSETVFHSSNFVPLTELPRVSYERR